jgi:hypothetical protein
MVKRKGGPPRGAREALELVLNALRAGQNLTQAAAAAGLYRTTLHAKRKRKPSFSLEVPPPLRVQGGSIKPPKNPPRAARGPGHHRPQRQKSDGPAS